MTQNELASNFWIFYSFDETYKWVQFVSWMFYLENCLEIERKITNIDAFVHFNVTVMHFQIPKAAFLIFIRKIVEEFEYIRLFNENW